MDAGGESARGTWNPPQCRFPVEYSIRTLDNIRLGVMDAFFSLPRGGAEIGGVLLGKWEGARLHVLDYVPLECEHALGPSFTLSDADHERLAELVEAARHHPAGLKAVGWYHSHTRSEIFLSDADLAIHKRYFPEPWQVALVLKPHTFRPMRCGFFFRDEDGTIKADAPVEEFELAALPATPAPRGGGRPRPIPGQEPEGPAEPRAIAAAEAETADPVREPVVPPEILPAAVTLGGRAEGGTGLAVQRQFAPEPAELPHPAEQLTLPYDAGLEAVAPEEEPENPEEPERRERQWRGMRALVTAAVVLAIAAAAFEARFLWLPSLRTAVQSILPSPPEPSLGLSTAENNGALEIRWDSNSPAVQNSAGGMLQITDGSPISRDFKLDRVLLRAGMFIYARQTERVDVALVVNQPDGKQVREVASFLGEMPVHSPGSDPRGRMRNQSPDVR